MSFKENIELAFYSSMFEESYGSVDDIPADKKGNIPILSEKEAKAMNPDYMLVLPWHFKDNIIIRETDYLSKGKKLIIPLPEIEII